MRRARPVLLMVPLLALVLTGCVGEPKPASTPITPAQACDALQDAVGEFYDVASPGSTVEELPNYDLPEFSGFRIPTPTCAFQVRPDPAVVPGDVFTIESFYLDYREDLTVTLPERLEAAGYKQKDPHFNTWAVFRLNRSYSASMIVYAQDDGEAYSEAGQHFRILDLTLSQN
ncbi:MAG TPA: hypothetical protein VGO65_12525 [Pseudolysinimonas sp.]|jgi:hypothetical protein|nr:hypothetical protein [Pseudolysinimonas sp.]